MASTYKYPLVNGHKIHGRKLQVIAWGFILAILGAGFIAGLYWLAFQQDWFGHSLKHWWDGGMNVIHSGNWSLYRHGWRDQIEPAAATILVLSFMFGVKSGSGAKKVHGMFTLIALGFALLVLASAMAFGEVWLLHFGIPRVYHLTPIQVTIAGFALGIISGKILHYIWLPAAATVQYHLVEGPISRGRTPLWVRLALAPPTLRERYSDLSQRVSNHEVTLEEKDAPSRLGRIFVSLAMFVFFAVAIVGIIARYYIGKGHVIPVLHS